MTFTTSSQALPTLRLMESSQLVLVSSSECHLCAHGRDVLERLGVGAREIEIESEEAQELAGAGVPLALLPILWNGARVVAYGRFSEKRLRRELKL